MPTYTFKCDVCQTEFDIEMSFTNYMTHVADGKIFPCPKCESLRTRKIIKSIAVIYKGAGFTKGSEPE